MRCGGSAGGKGTRSCYTLVDFPSRPGVDGENDESVGLDVGDHSIPSSNSIRPQPFKIAPHRLGGTSRVGKFSSLFRFSHHTPHDLAV